MSDPSKDPYAAAERKSREEQMAAVLGANLTLASVGITVEFSVNPPVDFTYRGKGEVRLTGVRANVTRYPGASADDEDPGPDLDVKGLIQPLTSSGEPSRREHPFWWFLPKELAETLLGRAMIS